jgi:hypothetical protein
VRRAMGVTSRVGSRYQVLAVRPGTQLNRAFARPKDVSRSVSVCSRTRIQTYS